MKYKLPRTTFGKDISAIASREIKKQKLIIPRASKKNLKEMADIYRVIESKGLPDHLVCKELPGDLGFGIFLRPDAKPLLKGQIIASYAGEPYLTPQYAPDDGAYVFAPLDEIHLTREEQKKFDPKRSFHPRRLYSLNIDAATTGNFSRFINHSARPNVMAELFRIPKNDLGLHPSPVEVVYLAKKTINPGEQLLVSYEGDGPSYWGALNIKPIPIFPKTFRLSPSLELIGSLKN